MLAASAACPQSIDSVLAQCPSTTKHNMALKTQTIACLVEGRAGGISQMEQSMEKKMEMLISLLLTVCARVKGKNCRSRKTERRHGSIGSIGDGNLI